MLFVLVRLLGTWPAVFGRTLGPWLGPWSEDGAPVYLGLLVLAPLAPAGRARWLAPVLSWLVLQWLGEALALRRQLLLWGGVSGYVLGADAVLSRLAGLLDGDRQASTRAARATWIASGLWVAAACTLAFLPPWLQRTPAAPQLAATGKANLLVITLDTTRADALGCYGARRAATPHLDGLARAGVLVERALAAAPHTHPSMATILTGRPPGAHGSVVGRPQLPAREVTLAEQLARCGYRTGGFFENPWMTREFGFDQGFGRFVGGASGRDPAAAAVRWLEEVLGGGRGTEDARPERFYCHVHLFDPHGPYEPRAPWIEAWSPAYAGPWPRISNATLQAGEDPGALEFDAADRQRIADLYASEVAAVDVQVGVVLEALARHGVADNTLVVVTADHGEELFDHGGLHHGHTLFDEQLHVPLLVAWPGELAPGGRVLGSMGLGDLTPTVLDLLEVPALVAPDGNIGQSRAGAWPRVGGNPSEPRTGEAARVSSSRFLLRGRNWSCSERWPWKLIVDWPASNEDPWGTANAEPGSDLQARLYHLGRDPEERFDQAESEPAVLAEMLDHWQAGQARGTWTPAGPGPEAPEMLERMRGLGYTELLEEWRARQSK